MLFQGLAVFPHNVVQTQVQLVERQRLLCVGCCFPCGIVICFLKQTTLQDFNSFKPPMAEYFWWKHSEALKSPQKKIYKKDPEKANAHICS